MKKTIWCTLLSGFLFSTLLVACTNRQQPTTRTSETAHAGKASPENEAQLTQERLRRFDSLDFQFYSHQRWDSFTVSHDPNIKVYYPDGTITTGLFPQHIDMLKPMFTFAPDTKITSHPVKFGSGDWTCVIGELEGTFSKPMQAGGKSIPPTGKKFKLQMCTVGHWKGDKMIEEYLFWDNQAMMKQLGLAQ